MRQKPVKGIKLYNQAKKFIPGGTQLLSKRPELYLPNQWPAYFSRARGVEVWDLDGNKYIDTQASIGACILGYADPDVNQAVKNAIDKGNTSTLNCPEEVELARLLTSLHPWSDMVRYARSGGEAMAIAVRIARAYTGQDKIAFCGYHGWSDWYLASNLASQKNLDGHLLPGLAPAGVPRGLTGTSLPFQYNKIEQLEKIVKKHKLAAIIMEPLRYQEPKNNFLSQVRAIATKHKTILIFDEITIGWRLALGGAHLKYKVNPDMAVFAKGMSNGYPMAAVIGRERVMQAAQRTFISSSSWTERLGSVAALATIKKMRASKVQTHLNKIGRLFITALKKSARQAKIQISFEGLPPLFIFSFNYGVKNQAVNTLFTQEMLKRGFIAVTGIDVSYALKLEHVKKYCHAAKEVFDIIKKAVAENKVGKLLHGPIAHEKFKRLT
ncbi:aminotransferase class III [Candidatus Kuenenbacteria bacterium CG2_30_39_24]|uniref:Aminotransferase class III n=1 Tax=Candidatus Kuenenbacteria bacterium CG2_30_39_24 TaxID=1805236 RepID=A0A1J5FEJ2_9BACT|nr:MAG: aminotransferase class III [Candidatus Kuenenbacteria bacterium CG2_30_39_24]